MPLTITAINRYPVKSCRGESLRAATVEPWGLAGDRRWMVVDDNGEPITAREYPRLVLTTAQLVEGGVHLTHPEAAEVTARPLDGVLIDADVWGTPVKATLAGDDGFFARLLGVPARLVYLDDPTRRPSNPLRTKASDRVSFADGYPLLLASEASLAAVNDWIAEGSLADEGPLPMTRFRPSVVVRGGNAWDEDTWRRVRIGAAEFRVVKGCDRCVLTTIDPDTAAKGKEPIATLARHRKWDGKVWFAVNLVPDTPGATISVGDDLEVLEAVQTREPLR